MRKCIEERQMFMDKCMIFKVYLPDVDENDFRNTSMKTKKIPKLS